MSYARGETVAASDPWLRPLLGTVTLGALPMEIARAGMRMTSQGKLLKCALDVLECLLNEPRSMGITQIATRLGLPKSTTFRMLTALVELGFVAKDERLHRYGLNASIFGFIHELAFRFGPVGRYSEILREEAKRVEGGLYVCCLSGGNTYVVAASGSLGDSFALGLHAAVYCSSAGKVLVASQPKSEWSAYLPSVDAPRLTRHTNTDPGRFLAELEQARASGVAWSREETSLGCVSVAASIREMLRPPRMAVAIVLRKQSMPFRDYGGLEQDVRRIASRLEKI